MSITRPMSPEEEAKFQVEWAERLAKLQQPVLTPQQQYALFILAMKRSQLAAEIVAVLRQSTVRAGAVEYSELIRLGYAVRERGTSYHELTPKGAFQADRLAKIAAKELGIHFFVQGGSRFQTCIRCTCGFVYYHSRNEGHERSAFARRSGEHLAAVGKQRASIVAGPVSEHEDSNGQRT